MNRGASAAVIDTNQPSANLKIGPSNPLTTLRGRLIKSAEGHGVRARSMASGFESCICKAA
jgi:hypothetical protein